MKSIVISAHNPMTGPRHLGHYVSTMSEWQGLQRNHELFIVIDDLIAMILYPGLKKELQARTLRVAKEFIATGVDFESNHLVLTSMLPEVHELALYTACNFDWRWCESLYHESFGGLLTAYQRRELGLPRTPSIAEVIYPQLHLATLALGVRADFFQGGEEMRGYLPVLDALVEDMTPQAHFRAPVFLPGRSTFLPGVDGSHMATENAIFVSDDPASIQEQVSRISRLDTIHRWADAFDSGDKGSRFASSIRGVTELGKGTSIVAEFLVQQLRPFREAQISAEKLGTILERSALATRTRLNDTLIEIKSAQGISGYA